MTWVNPWDNLINNFESIFYDYKVRVKVLNGHTADINDQSWSFAIADFMVSVPEQPALPYTKSCEPKRCALQDSSNDLRQRHDFDEMTLLLNVYKIDCITTTYTTAK